MEDIHKILKDIIIPICNGILFPNENRAVVDGIGSLSTNMWEKALRESSIHGMLPVVIRFFEGKSVENKQLKMVVLKNYVVAQGNRSRYQKRLQCMRDLSEMLASENIDVMFFKGAVLAQLYPEPEMRAFNDVDFFLYGDSSKGIEVMSHHGINNEASYHHHTKAVYQGVLLENHYDFLERINHQSDVLVDDELKRLVAEEGKNMKVHFMGDEVQNAYEMTPTMNAIFLMRHMLGHFASETIPLRMLYDWAIFLKHDGDKVDWNRVIVIYEKSGTSTFAGVIQTILRLYLSVDIGDCPIKEVDGQIVDKVWDSIQNPPAMNPYKQFSFRFFVFETKVYIENRWKYELAYPHESYFMLSLHYAWSIIKRKLGLLKV